MSRSSISASHTGHRHSCNSTLRRAQVLHMRWPQRDNVICCPPASLSSQQHTGHSQLWSVMTGKRSSRMLSRSKSPFSEEEHEDDRSSRSSCPSEDSDELDGHWPSMVGYLAAIAVTPHTRGNS